MTEAEMSPVCSVEDCTKPPRSKGLCNAHYKQWRKYGDPEGGRWVIQRASDVAPIACQQCGEMMVRRPWESPGLYARRRWCGRTCANLARDFTEDAEDTALRFWSRVDRSADCWVWTGARHSFGYGQFGVGGRNLGAHRYSYELAFGPIPEGMLVCHHCDNPPCVRPEHLFLGTYRDNLADASAKGRLQGNPGGPGRPRVIDDDAVAALRAQGLTFRQIGERIGCSSKGAHRAFERWSAQ